MKALRKFLVAAMLMFVLLPAGGCVRGRKDAYFETQVGPHGQVTSRKVQYTPEQMAERDKAMGYREPPPPDIDEIQKLWPKLTLEQRASVVQTVKQMAEPK